MKKRRPIDKKSKEYILFFVPCFYRKYWAFCQIRFEDKLWMLTRDHRKKKTLTVDEEFPVEMGLDQSKPPYDVVKKWDWDHWDLFMKINQQEGRCNIHIGIFVLTLRLMIVWDLTFLFLFFFFIYQIAIWIVWDFILFLCRFSPEPTWTKTHIAMAY